MLLEGEKTEGWALSVSRERGGRGVRALKKRGLGVPPQFSGVQRLPQEGGR